MGYTKITEIRNLLETIYDPEIPVNIVDLGLIYGIAEQDGLVEIIMTFTSPQCPAMEILPAQIEDTLAVLEWVCDVEIKIVWDPPWSPALIPEDIRFELGL